jgi:hypothetical protein
MVALEPCLLWLTSEFGVIDGVSEYTLLGPLLAGGVPLLDRCCEPDISGPELVLGRATAVAMPICTSCNESSEGREYLVFDSISIARGRGFSAQGRKVVLVPRGAVLDRLRCIGSVVSGRGGM